MTVRIAQSDLTKKDRYPLRWLRQVARQPFACLSKTGCFELSLTITDDPHIHKLNRDFRGQDKPTDVLSFAATEAMDLAAWPKEIPLPLGDVVISLATVRRQAQENDISPDLELAWVLLHGILHLLGYDHQTEKQRSPMRALENQCLRELGIDRVITV